MKSVVFRTEIQTYKSSRKKYIYQHKIMLIIYSQYNINLNDCYIFYSL